MSDMRVGGGSVAAGMAQRPEAQAAGGKSGFLDTFHKLPDARFRTTASGLKLAVMAEGQGQPPAAKGMTVKVRYSGWLEDGTRFDSSEEHGDTFEVTLGEGRVIKGWEEGLLGMRPGEKRQLVIPAALAYGNRQVGSIPPGATLIFNVEAVEVSGPAANTKGTMSVVA
ncbi:MAG TPA: FKBP-type peptidyl-prolyl cis-trans isomerase [bacterium]|nr:FKBP-type peptidyl-prolyl cis-trans isomerase [bacterium]